MGPSGCAAYPRYKRQVAMNRDHELTSINQLVKNGVGRVSGE